MKPTETREINVVLTVIGETDVLIFDLDDTAPEKYAINLNDSMGQSEIKRVFSKLLEILIDEDITLEFKVAEGYSKGLFRDVCSEYVQDLNREIKQVKETIKQIAN